MEGTAVSLEEQRQSDAPVPATGKAPAAPAPVTAPVLAAANALRGAFAALPGRTSTLARAQAAASQLVPQLQYQIARLGPAGQAGLAALVAALVVALSTLLPAHRALQALSADLARAQHRSAEASADQAIPHLLASLPTRAQIPAVIGQVVTQAKAAGVSLDVGHYVYTPARSGAIAHYDLEFPVKASYPDIRSFINRTLSAVPAAAVNKLHVERKAVGEQVVNANIGFVVFVRSE
jgi:hypothetical protein